MLTDDTRKESRKNPFFEQYNTPHHTVPFNIIHIEDYEPAFREGILRENELIQYITKRKEPPSFENTIIAKTGKEYYYGLLSRVSDVFFNLLSAEGGEEMEELAMRIQPMLTKHANDISMNKAYFDRVKSVMKTLSKYQGEDKMLLQECYDGLVRSGAKLNDSAKEQLRIFTENIGKLSLRFAKNLLKETKTYVLHILDEADLEGLPDTIIDAALQEAKSRGFKGWVFTLDAPSYGPFMTYSSKRDLREEMYMMKNTLCYKNNEENNVKICNQLIDTRRKIARLFGYGTFAKYVLEKRMAGLTKNVRRFLDSLIQAYMPRAKEEMKELEEFARSINPEDTNFTLKPWDISYYSHKLRLKLYDIDAEKLRPYFELARVIKGVFNLATTLYGITFKENESIPVYHPDVKAYEVYDNNGAYLAVLYADFHPRKNKKSGAWTTQFQGQYIDAKGINHRPHVSIVTNFTKPTKERPSLLTLGEIETLLHEFGHALHSIFANTKYESLSGTNVMWDFVELPSQIMENYAVEEDFLKTFAFHYQTGEPIPDELVNKVSQSRNFMVANACLKQVQYALLDISLHSRRGVIQGNFDMAEKAIWKKISVIKDVPKTCMTVQFSHIMAGGYAAGYYSYKWAEVIEADAFALFKEKGIFNRDVAQSFRENILSKGGTEHPMILYKNFRGREPKIDALLKRNGIKLKEKSGE